MEMSQVFQVIEIEMGIQGWILWIQGKKPPIWKEPFIAIYSLCGQEHEMFFINKIKHKKMLSIFESVFGWGNQKSLNDVDLDKKYPVDESVKYCKNGLS